MSDKAGDILRAAGITVSENTSKETTVIFLGPKGTEAMRRRAKRKSVTEVTGGIGDDFAAQGRPLLVPPDSEPDLEQEQEQENREGAEL